MDRPASVADHAELEPSALVLAAAREAAGRRFQSECGSVVLPVDALMAVEVTGDSHPDYAVMLGRATCAATGGATFFSGTGGAIVQFWTVRDGKAVELADDMMHGFTPIPGGILIFQHGSFCGDFPGASLCVATYAWSGLDRGLTLAGRRVYDDAHPGDAPAMLYDWGGVIAQ